jgi:hypothetical protein
MFVHFLQKSRRSAVSVTRITSPPFHPKHGGVMIIVLTILPLDPRFVGSNPAGAMDFF